MKKVILFLAMSAVIVACKSTSATNTKEDSRSQLSIKGNWNLEQVTYPGSEFIKVTSFQIADSKCFEGSTWKFVSNNNTGQLTLDKAGCSPLSSPITWFINKEGQFVLKILNAGEKARKVREGYVLSMGTVTENTFQLVDKIDVGGKPTAVVYQFRKIN